MPKPKRKAPQGNEREVLKQADGLLAEIRIRREELSALEAEMQARIEQVRAEYEEELAPYRVLIESADKALMQVMKFESQILFAAGDVVTLPGGSLVRSEGWKVTIPRDALIRVKEEGFTDVIKIVESLDREAIEKWASEKLLLIGAKKKPATKYSYEVKAQGSSNKQQGRTGEVGP